jgi:hypothetical protein
LTKTLNKLLPLILWLAWALAASAQTTPIEIMLSANRSYETGDYEQAIAGYEALLTQKVRYSSVLYYNLGNAYFKRGDLGRAILNYRRAQQLTPRDADIAANLALARAQTVDRLEGADTGLWSSLAWLTGAWLTLDEVAVLLLAVWCVLNALAVAAILLPRLRRWLRLAMIGLGLVLALGLLSVAARYYTAWQYPPLVVVAPTVAVTSAPDEDEPARFTLHAGAEAYLLDALSGWRRIQIAGNLEGWTPAQAVEPVNQE